MSWRIFNDEYWSSVCKRKLIWWWCQLTRRQGHAGGQTWSVKAEMLSERGDRCIHCEEFNLPMEKLWLFTSQSHGTYMYRAAARNRKTYSQVGKTDTQSHTLMAQREYAGQKKCLFSCVRNYIMWWRVAQVHSRRSSGEVTHRAAQECQLWVHIKVTVLLQFRPLICMHWLSRGCNMWIVYPTLTPQNTLCLTVSCDMLWP